MLLLFMLLLLVIIKHAGPYCTVLAMVIWCRLKSTKPLWLLRLTHHGSSSEPFERKPTLSFYFLLFFLF